MLLSFAVTSQAQISWKKRYRKQMLGYLYNWDMGYHASKNEQYVSPRPRLNHSLFIKAVFSYQIHSLHEGNIFSNLSSYQAVQIHVGPNAQMYSIKQPTNCPSQVDELVLQIDLLKICKDYLNQNKLTWQDKNSFAHLLQASGKSFSA